MSIARQDFGLRAYTSKVIVFTITSGGLPLDLTGWSLLWKMSPQPAGAATLQKNSGPGGGITITNAAQGQAQLQIDGGTNGDVQDSGLYWHTLDGTPPAGQPVDLLEGRVIVDPSPIPSS